MHNICHTCKQPITEQQESKQLELNSGTLHFHGGNCYTNYVCKCYHDYANSLCNCAEDKRKEVIESSNPQ